MPTQLRVLSDPPTPCVCVRARVHAKQVTRLATLATCYYAQFGDSTLQAPALSRHRYQIPLYFHHPPPQTSSTPIKQLLTISSPPSSWKPRAYILLYKLSVLGMFMQSLTASWSTRVAHVPCGRTAQRHIASCDHTLRCSHRHEIVHGHISRCIPIIRDYFCINGPKVCGFWEGLPSLA